MRGGRCAAVLVAAIGLLAGPAGAATYHLGGIDDVSSYTYDANTGTGVFTFANQAIGQDPTLSGQVTTDDVGGIDFFDLDGNGTAARVDFSIYLSGTQNPSPGDGVSAFDADGVGPDSNIKKARFLGGYSSADFVIYQSVVGQPNVMDGLPLLTFNVDWIDVTNATKQLIGIDPDGSITFGDATETAVTSFLTVTGGTQAALVGGVGAEARLSMILTTLTPAITDFKGYFGQDFTSGVGAAPVAGLAWDLTVFTPVPEPGTASLLGVSLAGLAWLRRRGGMRH